MYYILADANFDFFPFSLNVENVGECCKAQWVCVHQRIVLCRSYLALLSWTELNCSPGVSEPAENTVRVFIGMEYECPRGHRFFCSAPDKIIKVLGNCSVKVSVLKGDCSLHCCIDQQRCKGEWSSCTDQQYWQGECRWGCNEGWPSCTDEQCWQGELYWPTVLTRWVVLTSSADKVSCTDQQCWQGELYWPTVLTRWVVLTSSVDTVSCTDQECWQSELYWRLAILSVSVPSHLWEEFFQTQSKLTKLLTISR